jgi:hypothetical protein
MQKQGEQSQRGRLRLLHSDGAARSAHRIIRPIPTDPNVSFPTSSHFMNSSTATRNWSDCTTHASMQCQSVLTSPSSVLDVVLLPTQFSPLSDPLGINQVSPLLSNLSACSTIHTRPACINPASELRSLSSDFRTRSSPKILPPRLRLPASEVKCSEKDSCHLQRGPIPRAANFLIGWVSFIVLLDVCSTSITSFIARTASPTPFQPPRCLDPARPFPSVLCPSTFTHPMSLSCTALPVAPSLPCFPTLTSSLATRFLRPRSDSRFMV